MDTMEFNKIAGAVLSALLVIFGGSTLVHELTASHGHSEPAYKLADVAEGAGHGGAAAEKPAAAAQGPIFAEVQPLLASATVDAGAAAFNKCKACHTVEKGGANKVGPNLWGVVQRDKGSVEGFAYSAALAGAEGNWTIENLAGFVNNPKGYLPGNKMGFAGIAKPQELANILAYLNSLSDSPKPLAAKTQ